MLVEIAEAMGLKFRETDYESNYWFEFNGKTILVMYWQVNGLKEATEHADCGPGLAEAER